MSGVGVRIQQYGRIVSIIVATLSILAAVGSFQTSGPLAIAIGAAGLLTAWISNMLLSGLGIMVEAADAHITHLVQMNKIEQERQQLLRDINAKLDNLSR